jgi:hypothetical protein
MKTKPFCKKLEFNKITVSNLSSSELVVVNGGRGAGVTYDYYTCPLLKTIGACCWTNDIMPCLPPK